MNYPVNLPKSRYGRDKAHNRTKEFNHITISSNITNKSNFLGFYYLDMREAFHQYNANIFGDFDDFGVPLVGWGNKAKYSPVTIAQYGFILHDIWLKNKSQEYLSVMNACLNQLISMESLENECIFWRENYYSARYNLKKNWTSAMSMGECLSFYLRMYQISYSPDLLEKCHKIYRSTNVLVQDGGMKTIDEEGNWWLEEYPSNPPSYVLNGFIYAIFGIEDYYRVTGFKVVEKALQEYYKTLKQNIHLYDVDYWSIYDLHNKELVKVYYQKNVHIPQLESLYFLTGYEKFKIIAEKWRKTLNPTNIMYVKLMYRIRPRILRLKKIFQ